MISVSDALNLVMDSVVDYGQEVVGIEQCLGRVLGENILADRDFPPFNRVAMDGVAIQAESFQNGLKSFAVEGILHAGQPSMTLQDSRKCIEVMTGASLPVGCDAVIPVEEIATSEAGVTINRDSISKWQNVHQQGADSQTGDILLESGTIINPVHLAVIAGVGKTQITVKRKPQIAIVTTGDELVDIDKNPLPHQIRRTNPYLLQGFLSKHGFEAKAHHIGDDYEQVLSSFKMISKENDVVISTGGVSMGKKDHIPNALKELGVETMFHKVNQKPGKPLFFGTLENKRFFGLPGNPVSTLICTLIYLLPYLKDDSMSRKGKLMKPIASHPKHRFLAVKTIDNQGITECDVIRTQGSGDYTSIVPASGFISLLPDTEYEKGEIVSLFDI